MTRALLRRSCIILLASLPGVSGCTSSGVEPVPGSITYGGHQPRTKLTKSPIGSTFTTQIIDETGCPAIETYQIQPDRSLKLLRRSRSEPSDSFGTSC